MRKSHFLHFGDRQTNKQVDSTDALSRSRYRERRLNNGIKHTSSKESMVWLFVCRYYKYMYYWPDYI